MKRKKKVRADGRDPTEMASFWAARGKKTLTPYGVIKADEEDLDREDDGDDRRSRQPPQHLVPAEPLIAALMAATADKRSAGDTPFWAARGKKDPSANFWAARGKKGKKKTLETVQRILKIKVESFQQGWIVEAWTRCPSGPQEGNDPTRRTARRLMMSTRLDIGPKGPLHVSSSTPGLDPPGAVRLSIWWGHS